VAGDTAVVDARASGVVDGLRRRSSAGYWSAMDEVEVVVAHDALAQATGSRIDADWILKVEREISKDERLL
jgi:hypothetical protein